MSRRDRVFVLALAIIGGVYLFLIAAMILADISYTSPAVIRETLASPEIQYALKLSIISCTLTTVLSLWVAVALGYLLARFQFRGKALLDSLLDIPIVLPPLVVGLSLLILFSTAPGVAIENAWHQLTGTYIRYDIPAVILAQFMVACAFAVRTMRATFEEITPRREQVALTLGCSRAQAFWMVAVPEARRGILVAATIAWARSLGEFGPILMFAGATRMKTEVLPTSVYLEMSVGNVGGAVAISLVMIVAAVSVLILVRTTGAARYAR